MKHQKGFALPDALIAAAIGAMVAVSAAEGLGVAVRSARAAEEMERVVAEGETIAARLRAGLTNPDALAGLSGWRLETAPYVVAGINSKKEGPKLSLVTASHDAKPSFEFQLVLLDDGDAR